jgi:hypothetical protein
LAIVASNARKIDATAIEACFRSSFSDESTFQTLLHKLTDAIKGALSHGGPSMERDGIVTLISNGDMAPEGGCTVDHAGC